MAQRRRRQHRQVWIEGLGVYPLAEAAKRLGIKEISLRACCAPSGFHRAAGREVRWDDATLPAAAPESGVVPPPSPPSSRPVQRQPDAILRQRKCRRCGTIPMAGKRLDKCPVCNCPEWIRRQDQSDDER